MTLVTGGELFTGNTALVTAAYKEGKIGAKDLAKSWITSYIGNFVGSLFLAYFALFPRAPGKVLDSEENHFLETSNTCRQIYYCRLAAS